MEEREKRRRGRPRGSGLNDTRTLEAIAEMMSRTPRLRATTALRRIDPDVEPATKRRIQAKWRRDGERLLAEVRARAERAATERSSPYKRPCAISEIGNPLPTAALAVGDALRQQAAQLASVEAARTAALGVEIARVRAALQSSGLLSVREIHDSPGMRTAREIYNSPAMAALREFHNSPAMVAMREFQDSPAMRLAREAQTALRLLGR